MLDEYFAVRSAWLPAFVKMLPDKIRECRLDSGAYSTHFPPKHGVDGAVITVPPQWWVVYDTVADMLDLVGVGLRSALRRAGPTADPLTVSVHAAAPI